MAVKDATEEKEKVETEEIEEVEETEEAEEAEETKKTKKKPEKKKKRHIIRKIFLSILSVILIAALVAVIYLIPTWKDSKKVHENADMQHYSYVLRLTLEREALPHDLADALDAFAELTGIDRADMLKLRIEGRMDGDISHTLIYVEGISSPLTEMYRGGGREIINASMVYARIRANAVGKIMFADRVIPVWNDREYMTMDQMERMLEADMDELASLVIDLTDFEFSRKEMFLAMAIMKRKGHVYTLDAVDGMTAKLSDISGGEPMKLIVTIDDTDKAAADLEKKLSKLGVDISMDKLDMLKDVQLDVIFDGEPRLQMPDGGQMVSDTTVKQVAGIRSVLKKLL